MSTNRSIGRSASTQEKGRSASKSKKGRSPNLCAFTFADGRQCRTPRCSGHLHLCYFHAQKEAESLAAQQVGQDISRFLPTKLLTACDLGIALSRTFCAVARGDIKPKVASTLGYLAQTMLQSIPIAQHEYSEALGTDYWRGAIRSSFKVVPSQEPSPTPQPQPAQAASPSAPSPQPASQPAPAPTSLAAPKPPTQPAPSPHTPLPATSAEFAQQVMAGRNSSRSACPDLVGKIPTSSGLGRAAGTSGSSSSSAPSTTPAPASPPKATPRSPLATHHSPLPQAPPAPPLVPPGFGAPANWDALIPPKPRRRFSRHWQLPE